MTSPQRLTTVLGRTSRRITYTGGGSGGTGGNTGGGGTAPPAFDPALLTFTTQIASGCKLTHDHGAYAEGGTTASPLTVQADARNLRLAYGVKGFSSGSSGVTLKVALLHKGVVYPVTWDGGSATTHIPEHESKISDPTPGIVVRKGDKIHVLSFTSSGATCPGRRSEAKAGYLAGDQTGSTAWYLGASALVPKWGWLVGDTLPTTKSLAVLGDSIMDQGWIDAVLGTSGVPSTNQGMWAQATPLGGIYAPQKAGALGLPATHALSEYGANTCGQALNQPTGSRVVWFCTQQLTHWTDIASQGIKLAATTMFPRSNSTDGWMTLGSQSEYNASGSLGPGYDDVLLGYNSWLRDGSPLIGGAPAPGTTDPAAVRIGQTGHPLQLPIFDVAALCEAAPGRWKAVGGNALTVDGTHLSDAGMAHMAAQVPAWLAAAGIT